MCNYDLSIEEPCHDLTLSADQNQIYFRITVFRMTLVKHRNEIYQASTLCANQLTGNPGLANFARKSLYTIFKFIFLPKNHPLSKTKE